MRARATSLRISLRLACRCTSLARRALPGVAAIALTIGTVPAQTGAAAAQAGASNGTEAPQNEIVVSAFPNNDIVVNGRARRCRPTAGDPLDNVDASSGIHAPELMTIVPDGHSGYVWVRNAEQVTGPEFWQRVGVGMSQFVFRRPSTGKPMCVGGSGGIASFAGFRRIVDAAPYRGHRLRFTAWVATGRAHQVSFWLAAGTTWREIPGDPEKTSPRLLLNGGNTNNVSFGGNHDWTPVLLETGPIHPDADHISYGFNLQGWGDVWVYEPTLEIVASQPEDTRTDDLIVIGRER